MDHNKALGKQRQRRRYRVRKRVRGTADRPRLCVVRTLRHITVQVIDDIAGVTLASASTADKALAKQVKYGGNCAAAEAVGKMIAERATSKGVSEVCFDRGTCKYHGRVAALANAARAAGLQF
ncbi:50S ribosomal protein L18 [Bythopirellula polymerisocia]|uniref:Large ribosomal subunit protein uL18 n=1 Tax=Bythopirellula polymerisocia TaxID=2528003 RepID=A0A5C6CY60_9BACT|nr:50S ribosomal protein L18 [Bythopirellula polymerisocia]TWU29552.1 50S ribosomal protein L18 [Bythopirellula polymerisocia]